MTNVPRLNDTRQRRLGTLLLLSFIVASILTDRGVATADDWPMWRHDAGRTADSPQAALDRPKLLWTRELPPLTPAYRNPRLQFDAGYEPVVAGGRMLVASSQDDSVTAFDTRSGELLWKVHVDGPVRFAPVIWNDTALFGSDDGHLYCVSLLDGKQRWTFRAVPDSRRVWGNRRLISVWPVRGGPVVADGKIYFAAGVWSFEGVFLICLDAVTGEVEWINDRLGHVYGSHPHWTTALGGLAPQGYLIVAGNELIVPCSAAYPARVDRRSGELIEFSLPEQSRKPGGWFAAVDQETAKAARRGALVLDGLVNRQMHEDKLMKGVEPTGASRSIVAGGRRYGFDDPWVGVDGPIHSIVAADDKMFVVTRKGNIHCFGSEEVDQPKVFPLLEPTGTRPGTTEPAAEMLSSIGIEEESRQGIALVLGLVDGTLLRSLFRCSDYHVIGIDDDEGRIDALRGKLANEGLYGERVALIHAPPDELGLPPYIANLVTSEDADRWISRATDPDSLENVLRSLRPFGGVACLELSEPQQRRMEQVSRRPSLETLAYRPADERSVWKRTGSLPGSTDYRGDWRASDDRLVRAPLGVLWFDDTLGHFKRSPQPHFVDGVMISRPKRWEDSPLPRGRNKDYPLLPPTLSDMYTGRILTPRESGQMRAELEPTEPLELEPSQYRPPAGSDEGGRDPTEKGKRVNPLTGAEEPREFPKTYGCDGGIDYGGLFTMRSGTAAFYDKTCESGTIYVSGPRSGCTNSVIPAGGLLNVPYFYEGCTCSYPLPVALALYSMPETHEQWSTWGDGQPGPIRRVGVNFGAPGDRVTRDGTLWLDYPAGDGPSPQLDTQVTPEAPRFYYQHSVWMRDDDKQESRPWPWVCGSGVESMESFVLRGLQPGRYAVRLYFAEPRGGSAGERRQTISLQGRTCVSDLDVARVADGPLRGLVHEVEDVEVDGELSLELSASKGQTLISGLEIVRVDDGVEDVNR